MPSTVKRRMSSGLGLFPTRGGPQVFSSGLLLGNKLDTSGLLGVLS
jgi:hypothetical protein